MLRAHPETFLARFRDELGDRRLPAYSEKELRAALACGDLTRGFARVRCPSCMLDLLVPFSCKGRAFCPSCGGRRMAELAAHLVDRVLPHVPEELLRRVFATDVLECPRCKGRRHFVSVITDPASLAASSRN